MNMNDKKFMAQKIRTQYMERKPSELDELRELDKKVKRPSNIFAYTYGSLSAIIMGSGMSMIMTNIGESIGIKNALVPGIIIGIIGIVMAISTYPLFNLYLKRRRQKYADKIVALSDRILEK